MADIDAELRADFADDAMVEVRDAWAALENLRDDMHAALRREVSMSEHPELQRQANTDITLIAREMIRYLRGLDVWNDIALRARAVTRKGDTEPVPDTEPIPP